jgi:hypothetical protein
LYLFEYLLGKLFTKGLGQMELDDGKLPEANGQRHIHISHPLRIGECKMHTYSSDDECAKLPDAQEN